MSTFKLSVLSCIAVTTLSFFSGQSLAQVDPSAALLLRSSGKAPQKEELNSSRYQVRPGSSTRTTQPRPPQSTSTTRRMSEPAKTKEPVQPTNVDTANSKDGDTKDVVASKQNDIRKKMNSDDYRQNIIDLHISPVYMYNQSSSNYWYRQYLQASNGFQIGADVWFTPEFGVKTNYMTTSAAAIDGSVNDDGRISTENDWFNGELMFRNFLSDTSESKAIVLGVGYSEYEMTVSSVADERIGVKSSGFKVRAEAILPSSKTHQWSFGVEYMPRVDHQEVNSQITVESGDDNESSQIGVHVGGRFLLSREHQLFWRVDHRIERNLFSGTSNLNDPRSDVAPVEGVEVTNTFTIFSLGYTWGH